MNYFTPERIARYGSEDPATWHAAEAGWEEVGDRYVAYLDTVRPEFPAGLHKIDESYYLHDAVIRGMGQEGRSFVIVLQLDTPPHSLLTFTYDLVDDPAIDREALPADYRSTGAVVDWQYDEIERVPGDPVTWRQSVLLSNGWEVRLHFRDVKVQEAQALLPAPRTSVAVPLPPSVPQPA
ncbi:MAG TPA: hypothetical protein VKA46_17340 [Gemmataceae bacterium]|nr:hypothetical protein [Gemmataceae bacterium]